MNKAVTIVGSFTIAGSLCGCGTLGTLSHVSRDTPIVYGGTRLDVAAINDDTAVLKRFAADPPVYPKADLPASFILDTALLPGTLVVAAFRAMFW